MIRRPPRSTLFPSPTLFRSQPVEIDVVRLQAAQRVLALRNDRLSARPAAVRIGQKGDRCAVRELAAPRSEEHTSELQSHSDLVCRLLLANKNDSDDRTDRSG